MTQQRINGYVKPMSQKRLVATQAQLAQIARIKIVYVDGERLITVVTPDGEIYRGQDFGRAGEVMRSHNASLTAQRGQI